MKQRGFTMVEFLVATAIAGIITLGVLELLRGQISGYDRQQRLQDAQSNVRGAMDQIVGSVRNGGFGIAAEYMVGLGTANNRPAVGPAPETICAGTDVLEIRARQTLGYWKAVSAAGPALTVRRPLLTEIDTGTLPGPVPIYKGMYLFVFTTPGRYAMVRANATLAVPAAPTVLALVADTESTKLSGLTVNASDVMPVDSVRYFISCTNPAHPRLMLDEGMDKTGDGVLDGPIVAAEEIEDLQVAYLLDTDQDGVLSSAEITAAVNTVTAAQYSQIKAVRVSIVGRSAGLIFGDTTQTTVSMPPVLEDHNPGLPEDAYARRVLQQTILLENRDTMKGPVYDHMSTRYL